MSALLIRWIILKTQDGSRDSLGACGHCDATRAELEDLTAQVGELNENNAKLYQMVSKPGACWSKAVNDLSGRGKGKATDGLALLTSLTEKQLAADDAEVASEDQDVTIDDAPRPRRAAAANADALRRQAPNATRSEDSRRSAARRGAGDVEAALFVAGGGDVERTGDILTAVNERASRLGIGNFRGLQAVSAGIKGYFDLAGREKGTRPKYAQQKVDAVMEAITPADAAPRRLIASIARLCGYGNEKGVVPGSVSASFSDAAERRAKQEDAGRIFDHRNRTLRKDSSTSPARVNFGTTTTTCASTLSRAAAPGRQSGSRSKQIATGTVNSYQRLVIAR